MKLTRSKISIEAVIALIALLAIALHFALQWQTPNTGFLGIPVPTWPLAAALILGGLPLIYDLVKHAFRREFGSDLLAGISIVTSAVLHEYLAGVIVVLMLSGGQTLERFAVRGASSVLENLARRMPTVAHLRRGEDISDVPVAEIAIGDVVEIYPHETCPVDGVVRRGHGRMDESYLTGEPYMMSKAPGAEVLSGSINGESVLSIEVAKRAVDSRYAQIMQVMRESAQSRPQMRRIGDQLGAYYTPLAVGIAVAAWLASGDPIRFLAVMVIATPCPLLIAIPVAIIGSISLAAKRGIIVKDPAILERIDTCHVAIFDKTGTLTYGRPSVTRVVAAPGLTDSEILSLVASLERYSKHPLGAAIVAEAQARHLALGEASSVSEKPGEGFRGVVDNRRVLVTNRRKLLAEFPEVESNLPPPESGMECVIAIDGRYAATIQFRDEPRGDGKDFVAHLGSRHHIERVALLSGDRESEVSYLARLTGISEVHAGQSPEQKLDFVREVSEKESTLFVGDGINDAPALAEATVGVAFGQGSDVTMEAAGAVIMDSSLHRLDELVHIGRRMRFVALQSALGGMALSVVGMLFASFGLLPPVTGALCQEVIDVLAVVNALRAAIAPKSLTDY